MAHTSPKEAQKARSLAVIETQRLEAAKKASLAIRAARSEEVAEENAAAELAEAEKERARVRWHRRSCDSSDEDSAASDWECRSEQPTRAREFHEEFLLPAELEDYGLGDPASYARQFPPLVASHVLSWPTSIT